MLLVAIASYIYVERPLRFAEWSTQSWRSIAYGGAGLATAAVLVLLLNTYSSTLFIRAYNVVVPPDFEPLSGSHLPFNPTCVIDGAGRALKSNTFDLCTVAPAKKDGQMLFALGDSHAGALQGLLNALHEQLG
jgi:hypothetical protein